MSDIFTHTVDIKGQFVSISHTNGIGAMIASEEPKTLRHAKRKHQRSNREHLSNH